MNSNLSKIQTVLATFLLCVMWVLSNAAADGMTPPDDVKRACLSKTTTDSSYMEAVERVTSMPMVNAWVGALGAREHMAVGMHIDKTEYVQGNCYWSISIYKSDSSQLQLWKVFRVGLKSNPIYVMGDDGNYLPLSPTSILSK